MVSGSRAEDAGYRTAADVALVAAQTNLAYRLVGGLAVSLLHAAHGSPGETRPRLTADADLGVDDKIVAEVGLAEVLRGLGYQQSEGNRFIHGAAADQRVIDVLIPTVGDRLQTNVTRGDLVLDAVPGLGLALDTPPMVVSLSVWLSTGESLDTTLHLPDVIPALSLKASP